MKKLTTILVSVLLIAGCGYATGTLQKADKSYLIFTGNLENVRVYLDDIEPFTPERTKHYQISPGEHIVTAYRGDRLVLHRVVILQSQLVTEVNIP